jgi:thioesterase domain-containing protein/acyl carrier protein
MYGPTETTVWSSVQRIDRGEGSVPIGPPIANTQFYIVDRALQPLPLGAIGELLIGGDGLARGYLNRSDLTAEKFIAAPFLTSGPRLYRTGDLARFLPDGRLEFFGRLDFQVKVRGYRIELEEIEHVLNQNAAVGDAVVVIWEDAVGDKRLVAYYTPVQGLKPDAGDLKKAVQEKLPEYMCPSFFVEMDEFPVTPNGKINRKAFPPPTVSTADEAEKAVAPRREAEVRLAALWQQVLNQRSIGIDDNFFDRGGHSLLAARLFAMIEKHLGVRLPLAVLFEAPTIRTLAEKIEERSWKASWSSLVPIRTAGTNTPLFLIHGAEGNVLLYRSLVESLGVAQPVYALQSRGLDGHEEPDSTIEGMAATYVQEIESVQPDGPYCLGGYCMGGVIALEVARQLRRAGKQVAFLAMFETYNIQGRAFPAPVLRQLHKIQNLYFQSRNVLASLSEGKSSYLVEKIRVEISRLRVFGDILHAKITNYFNSSTRVKYQHLEIQKVNHRAQAIYEPTPYDGHIILFKPKGLFWGLNDPTYGWDNVASGGVRLVDLPNFQHGSLNLPFVKMLAGQVEQEIGRGLDSLVQNEIHRAS